jgi:ABC-2 type transport system ATP-binding protein
MIAVRDLKKSYAAIPALEGITFEVPTGTVTGFLGPNGAGKTTTLRILSGYMPATEGMAEVAGFDVRSESREVRKRTGYLPEDVPLYRDLTVSGFLSYMAGLKDVPAGAVKTEVNRVVEKTGLESVRDRLIFKCSRGYRQRTGLAMALLGDPPVLLLDEPTSGLDPNQVVEVRELIRDLSGEKTVLLSSHILSEVAQICGHVLIIHRGHLVAAGAPSELADRFGHSHELRLRTRGPVDEERLETVPGVRRVERMADPGGWILVVEDTEAAAPVIARLVMEGGGDLLELHPEASDLESVFRAVTLDEESGDA